MKASIIKETHLKTLLMFQFPEEHRLHSQTKSKASFVKHILSKKVEIQLLHPIRRYEFHPNLLNIRLEIDEN